MERLVELILLLVEDLDERVEVVFEALEVVECIERVVVELVLVELVLVELVLEVELVLVE